MSDARTTPTCRHAASVMLRNEHLIGGSICAREAPIIDIYMARLDVEGAIT
jgi:hypothetical protein